MKLTEAVPLQIIMRGGLKIPESEQSSSHNLYTATCTVPFLAI